MPGKNRLGEFRLSIAVCFGGRRQEMRQEKLNLVLTYSYALPIVCVDSVFIISVPIWGHLLMLSGPVPTDTVPLACLDGRVLSTFAHMVVASAITCISEVMQVARFSVGEYQH